VVVQVYLAKGQVAQRVYVMAAVEAVLEALLEPSHFADLSPVRAVLMAPDQVAHIVAAYLMPSAKLEALVLFGLYGPATREHSHQLA
jgi:hypothetical protein